MSCSLPTPWSAVDEPWVRQNAHVGWWTAEQHWRLLATDWTLAHQYNSQTVTLCTRLNLELISISYNYHAATDVPSAPCLCTLLTSVPSCLCAVCWTSLHPFDFITWCAWAQGGLSVWVRVCVIKNTAVYCLTAWKSSQNSSLLLGFAIPILRKMPTKSGESSVEYYFIGF